MPKAIVTRYLGPTDKRGSRIVAADGDGNRIIASVAKLEADALAQGRHVGMMGDALHELAAYALCEKMKWSGKLIEGGLKNGHVFVFSEVKQ